MKATSLTSFQEGLAGHLLASLASGTSSFVYFWKVFFSFTNYSQNRRHLVWNTQHRKVQKYVRAQPVLARAEPVLGPPKSSFGRASFPFINSSQNRWYLARNAQNRKIAKFARACSCLLVRSLCLLASQCGLTMLRSAVPETDWDHKVNCTYCMPEENYMDHIALSKLDFSGLWVLIPNKWALHHVLMGALVSRSW